jgi:hypothetical protein
VSDRGELLQPVRFVRTSIFLTGGMSFTHMSSHRRSVTGMLKHMKVLRR